MCCKHRLIQDRLCCRDGCVCVSHLGCNDHTAFDDHIRFCAKECRIPEYQIGYFAFFHRAYILGDSMCDSRVDGVFCNVTFYAEVVVSMSFIFWKRASFVLHFAGCLPCTCDNLAYTAHCLRIRTHHAENTHVMEYILCCDGLRTDSGISKSNVFRNLFVQVMAYHQHVQMLVQCVDGVRHSRVCGRRKYVWSCCSTDDIRCMAAACAFCMICMDGSSCDSCKSIFYAAAFIQSICMNRNLNVVFVCNV